MGKEEGEGTVSERDGGEGYVGKRNEESGSGEGGNLKTGRRGGERSYLSHREIKEKGNKTEKGILCGGWGWGQGYRDVIISIFMGLK